MIEEARYWRARCEVAERRADLFAEIAHELQHKFDPNQPRVPKGDPKGGQWTRLDGPGGRSKVDGDAEPAARRFRSPPGGGARVPRRSEAEAARTPTEEIVAPGSNPVGYVYRGARDNVRTVTRDEFDEIYRQLRAGSKESSYTGYGGSQVWQRGEFVWGRRYSSDNGWTIDVLRQPNEVNPLVTRIHQR